MKISYIIQRTSNQCMAKMQTSLECESVRSTHFTIFNSQVSDKVNIDVNFINATDMCVMRR
jgi:hypothetical protein